MKHNRAPKLESTPNTSSSTEQPACRHSLGRTMAGFFTLGMALQSGLIITGHGGERGAQWRDAFDEFYRDHIERHDPNHVPYKLGALAIRSSNEAANLGDDALRQQVDETTNRISQTVLPYQFSTDFRSIIEQPASHQQHPNEAGEHAACYTEDQVIDIVREHARDKDIALALIDSDDICNPAYAGVALRKPGPEMPPIDIIRPVGDNVGYVMAHELGHVIAPDKSPSGLGHASEMVCDPDRRVFDRRVMNDSVQALVHEGCGVVTHDLRATGEYSGANSVMGWRISPNQPLFAPIEIAQLDRSRQVTKLEQPTSGTYQLGYQVGDTFGLEIALPDDHILRQSFAESMPKADSIFIGLLPEADSDTLHEPYNSPKVAKGIGVFFSSGTDTLAHQVMQINPTEFIDLFQEAEQPSADGTRRWQPGMIYADEQLDIVIKATPQSVDAQSDASSYQLDILPLSSPEGKRFYDQHRTTDLLGKAELSAPHSAATAEARQKVE